MKPSWIQRIAGSRYAWAAAGGLCLAASFPKWSFAGLAWIAPGAIVFAALGCRGGEAFRIGFVGGWAYALAAFYWLLLIPFPAGAIAGWLALSAYLALYAGAWVWFCWRLLTRLTAKFLVPGSRSSEHTAEIRCDLQTPATAWPQPAEPSAWLARAPAIRRFLDLPAGVRVLWAISCAATWVALEMLLARLFTGFPWNLLGVSQYQILPVIQIAAWTGVYGVSFLVAWFSVAMAAGALALLARPTQSKAWVADLILPLVALLLVIGYGSTELARPQPQRRTLRAVLIQPSIPQTLIWDTNQNAIRFTQLIELSERALNQTTNAQVLVWPEAAVPNMLRYEWDTYTAVTNLAISHHVWMILGSDDAVLKEGGLERDYDFYNSSFLITPEGELDGHYRKRRLVIFGEYIPLEHWIPFMKYLTPVGGSFTQGRGPSPFALPDLHAKTSVLICFEDIFPHFSREYIEPDTDFLLNLTNNGWFGESAAQWQHAADAVFRTVENGIPLVRCANNGLTCWVDSHGGMHLDPLQTLNSGPSRNVYTAGFKVVDVPLLEPGEKRALTFYTRHGDWFGWACVGWVLLAGLGTLRRQVGEDAPQAILPATGQ